MEFAERLTAIILLRVLGRISGFSPEEIASLYATVRHALERHRVTHGCFEEVLSAAESAEDWDSVKAAVDSIRECSGDAAEDWLRLLVEMHVEGKLSAVSVVFSDGAKSLKASPITADLPYFLAVVADIVDGLGLSFIVPALIPDGSEPPDPAAPPDARVGVVDVYHPGLGKNIELEEPAYVVISPTGAGIVGRGTLASLLDLAGMLLEDRGAAEDAAEMLAEHPAVAFPVKARRPYGGYAAVPLIVASPMLARGYGYGVITDLYGEPRSAEAAKAFYQLVGECEGADYLVTAAEMEHPLANGVVAVSEAKISGGITVFPSHLAAGPHPLPDSTRRAVEKAVLAALFGGAEALGTPDVHLRRCLGGLDELIASAAEALLHAAASKHGF